MNKKERAELEQARADLASAKALGWPTYPRPEPMPRLSQDSEFNAVQHGWQTWFSGYEGRASKLTRSRIYSAGGHVQDNDPKASWSQSMPEMYPTELDALRVLRHDMSAKFARELATVDAKIAALESNPKEDK